MFSFREKYSPLGVDFGSRFIKVVQLKKTSKGICVFYKAVEQTPPETIEGGMIKDPEKIGRCLNKICFSRSFRSRRAVVSVRGENAILKSMVFPGSIRKSELEKVVSLELEKYFSSSPEDIISDYETAVDRSGQRRVLLAAVLKKVVEGYMEAIDWAGLYPQALETEAVALTRRFYFLLNSLPGNKEGGRQHLLMDIGAETVHVILTKDNFIRFSRCFSWDGIDYPELAAAVQRTVDYFEFKTREENPPGGYLFITGGKANEKGLGEYITGKLEVDNVLLEPMSFSQKKQNIFGIVNGDCNLTHTAAGLALRGWEDAWH